MARADLDRIKKLGIESMRFLADATDELELLRTIAEEAYEDNKIYLDNKQFLKTGDSDLWKKKEKLIKSLQRWKRTW
jgi:hypothetical protein